MSNFVFPEEILRKYSNKGLIIPSYKALKSKYTIDDLVQFDDLAHYLAEVNDDEADFTDDGLQFIRDVFGYEKLAEMLIKYEWYSYEYSKPEQIVEWLKWWETHAVKNQ